MKTDTPEKLLEALTVEAANMDTYKTEISFGAAELTESQQDRDNLAVTIDNADIADEGKKAVIKKKNDCYEGDPNQDLAPNPTFALAELPFPNVKAGALSRYQNRKARAKLASGYTKQIGLAMGYEDAPADPISPETLVAALKASDLGGYKYKVVYQKQGQSGMLVQQRNKGTEKWAKEFVLLESPAECAVDAPETEGALVQIEIRGRLLKGNQHVGQWSQIYPLTVNP